jgi:uncharacterized protein
MRYNVAALLMAPTGEVRAVAVDYPLDMDADGLCTTGPVRGRVQLMRSPAGVLVQGRLVAPARTECVRCLMPVDVVLALDLEEEFRPTIELPGGPQPDTVPEDRATLIDELNVLDLQEVVRQGLILAAPAHALCRPDCRGLCPRCGADLNDGPCGCQPETDARWSGLRSLVDRAVQER